ncbi:cysteine synthase family protein [Nonomuraea angiospora]|uniref:PLP-dependent cysteine synthase family protein n=1 Tax=Nonomuraea angiospora TaxID=46172 RepID=UPI00340BDA71
MLHSTVIDTIGHTPVVGLRAGDYTGVEVFAKLEMQNPFGMKDRVARQMILHARKTGELTDGAPVVESSSGTMALGLALVGPPLGHEVHIVTDPRIDPLTLAKLRTLGAAVHIVDRMGEGGWQRARLNRLDQLMRDLPGAYWPRQYSNPQNPAAYEGLAQELLDDCGRIDVLVGAVGSGGSLCGTARALRERLPGLRVVAVDCVGSMLFGQPDEPTRLQSGLGNSLFPANLDLSVIDEVHWLNDHEAFEATRRLAREQMIFGGNSSGSVYQVLCHLGGCEPSGTRVVGIFPDRGDRYHANIYSDGFWDQHRLAALPRGEQPQLVSPDTPVRSWSRCLISRP